jgi:PAS domain S-box-containing protein
MERDLQTVAGTFQDTNPSLATGDLSMEQIREARNFLASIVDSSDDAIISKDLDGYILSWNKGAERLYGYTSKETIGKHVSMLTPPDRPDEIPAIMNRLRRGELIDHYETVRVKKDGTRFNISLSVSPMKDASGKIFAASAISRDITPRKKEEEETTRLMKELTESLAQKNVLLQEVYHRVKNNLQVVSSLLELRARYVNENPSKAKEAFADSISRIRAMALVHEKLYKSESLHNVDFLGYLRALAQQLLNSYAPHGRIQVNVTGYSPPLNLDHAISLGLVFNELITNSLKYAFNSSKKGKIDIGFKVENDIILVELSDDGIGLPEKSTFTNNDTFGFRIVKLLLNQLNSQIFHVETKKGTSFRIEIPVLKVVEEANE